MTYNPQAKMLKTKVEYRPRVDNRNYIAYGWSSLSDYLAGSVSFRLNSASTLNLKVPNGDGKYTRFFHPGMEIRAWAEFESVTNALDIFRGMIPPGAGVSMVANPGSAVIDVFATGLIGLMAVDHVRLGQIIDADGNESLATYAGNEVSLAIRKVLEGGTFYSTDWETAIKPTEPIVLIGEDEELSDGFYTRKGIMDYYLDFAVDETDPDAPLEYAYYEGFAGTSPKFAFSKLPDPDSASPVKVLDYETDILTSRSTVKFDQTTHAICKSSSNSEIYEEFENSSLVRRHGRFSETLEMPTTNRDVLLRKARQYVAIHRRPVFALEVTLADVPGAYHLGQVVQVDNAQYGFSGNYVVTEIVFSFSPTQCNTKLVLAARRELLSEVLSS